MSDQLPYWVHLLQALSTPAIALLALVIGGMQWRTSHQRAVLDLFEKRWQSYTEFRGVIVEVVREGISPGVVSNRVLRAIDQAEFLFGPEVHAYLIKTHKDLLDLDLANKMEKTEHKDHDVWVQKRFEIFAKISNFFETIGPLVGPYMRMHQKMPSL